MLKIPILDMIYKIINSSLLLHITGLNGLMCYYRLLCYIWNLYLIQDHSHIHRLIVVIQLIFSLCLLIPWWPMHKYLIKTYRGFMCVIMFLKTLYVDVLQHQGIGRHSVGYVFTSNNQTRTIVLWLRAPWFPSYVFIRGMFISLIDSLFVGPFHGISIFPLIHTVV